MRNKLSSGLAMLAAASMAGCSPQSEVAPSPAADPVLGSGTVYTANERGNSLSIIDLAMGAATTVPIRISPHNVQASSDGRRIFAVGMEGGSGGHGAGEQDREPGTLLIFDAARMDPNRAEAIEVGRNPAHVIVDWQNSFAYVTNGGDNSLSVVDLAAGRVVARIGTGASPHGLRMSPNGREIYVANTGDDTVSIIDVAQRKEVARIPVGRAPAQVAFTPDGRRVYVTSTQEDSVVVVDTASRTRAATVPVGRTPIQLFATPDGRLIYVANEGTMENPDNRASVINTANNRVIATIATGRGAHGVVVSNDGTRAFISNSVENTVSIIDTTAQRVVRNVPVGEGPGGITFREPLQ